MMKDFVIVPLVLHVLKSLTPQHQSVHLQLPFLQYLQTRLCQLTTLVLRLKKLEVTWHMTKLSSHQWFFSINEKDVQEKNVSLLKWLPLQSRDM